MSAVERFRIIAAQDRFKGWPLIGEPELGPKIPYFGGTLNYKLQTGNGVEDYTSILSNCLNSFQEHPNETQNNHL